MNEIRADQARLRGVPARHGSRSSHRLEGVEKRDAGFGRHASFDTDQSRQDRSGFNFAAVGPIAAIHRAHQQNGGLRQRRVQPAHHFFHLGRPRLIDELGVAAFIGAVVDDHEIRMIMAQLGRPVPLVEGFREQGHVRAVDSEARVNHADRAGAKLGAIEPHFTFGDAHGEFGRARWHPERRISGAFGVCRGLHHPEFFIVRIDGECAAIRLAQVGDLDRALPGAFDFPLRDGARRAQEAHAAQSVHAVF